MAVTKFKNAGWRVSEEAKSIVKKKCAQSGMSENKYVDTLIKNNEIEISVKKTTSSNSKRNRK